MNKKYCVCIKNYVDENGVTYTKGHKYKYMFYGDSDRFGDMDVDFVLVYDDGDFHLTFAYGLYNEHFANVDEYRNNIINEVLT